MTVRGPAALAALSVTTGAALAIRPPPGLVSLAARLRGDIVFEARGAAGAAALTFDDGPHPQLTPGLLDVLARHRARATFFVMGSRAQEHPDLLRRIRESGHELGNHLWSDRRSSRQSAAEFAADLARTADAIGASGGLMRPAGGWIGREKVRLAHRLGLRCVLGSVYPYDAQVRLRPRIVDDVCRRTRPGSIIVLHEGDMSRSGVIGAVDRLLTGLADRGLAVVTVSELLGSD